MFSVVEDALQTSLASPKQKPGKSHAADKGPETRGAPSLEYIHHECFEDPGIEDRLWGPQRPEIMVPRYSLLPQVPDECPKIATTRADLSLEEERTLFLQYNYAKFRRSRAARLGASGYSRDPACETDLWAKRADATRENLVHANLPLVPNMAKRFNRNGVEFEELISEGYMALLKSVEKFDVSRGFRFSTYACRSILVAFRRLRTKAETARRHSTTLFELAKQRSDSAARRHNQQWNDAIEILQDVLRGDTGDLTDLERMVILQRFPIRCDVKPRILSEIGKRIGLSDRRAGLIGRMSMYKIRRAIE